MPQSLLAFHGEPAIKARCVASLEARLAAKEQSPGNWLDPDACGIPEWLTDLEAYLLKRMSRAWSRDFLQAAPVGADLDAIKGPFLVFLLRCAREKVEPKYAEVIAALDRSIALWERSDVQSFDWLNEARAAEEAAWEAARVADARPPWNAARAAAKAAGPAAGVAEVAYEASRAAERSGVVWPFDNDRFADELLRFMRMQQGWQRPSRPSRWRGPLRALLALVRLGVPAKRDPDVAIARVRHRAAAAARGAGQGGPG